MFSHVACGMSIAQPRIEPEPSAVEVWSRNHWTAREVPKLRDVIAWVPWKHPTCFLNQHLPSPPFREGNGTPLQYSCLENPMDGGAWWAAVHGVAKSRTWLSDFTFTFHFHALEEEMATHSSILAWRIPGKVGPGGLLSMGSRRVGHDWIDLAAAAATEVTTTDFCGKHVLD